MTNRKRREEKRREKDEEKRKEEKRKGRLGVTLLTVDVDVDVVR